MIVLDTDIVTLLSYGRTEKLHQRIATAEKVEELAITLITRMEILQGRYESIVKAASDDELLKAMERFRSSEALLHSFRLLEVNETAAGHFREMTRAKKKARGRRRDILIACIALAH